MTGEAAAAPKEEEEAKAVAGVVEAASAEEAEAVSIEEATARHDHFIGPLRGRNFVHGLHLHRKYRGIRNS